MSNAHTRHRDTYKYRPFMMADMRWKLFIYQYKQGVPPSPPTDDVAYLNSVFIVAKQRTKEKIKSAKHAKADDRSLSWLFHFSCDCRRFYRRHKPCKRIADTRSNLRFIAMAWTGCAVISRHDVLSVIRDRSTASSAIRVDRYYPDWEQWVMWTRRAYYYSFLSGIGISWFLSVCSSVKSRQKIRKIHFFAFVTDNGYFAKCQLNRRT